MSPAWTQRCPQGHANISPRENGYRCDSCGIIYTGEPLDARRHDFPVVESGTRRAPDADDVLEAFVGVLDSKGLTAVRVARLPSSLGTNRQLGGAMRQLKNRGFVEIVQRDRGRGNRWGLTERGRAAARGEAVHDRETGDFTEAFADD